MVITRLQLGSFETNCYIIRSSESMKCVLIDPADNGPEIFRTLKTLGTVPEAILLTHGHFDHILAIPYLQKCWPSLPVYCHPADCPFETSESYEDKVYPTVSAFSNLHFCCDNEEIEAAGLLIKVLCTPGHTHGSVVLLVENALFTGDTLFKNSIGRTDFPGGDAHAMATSLTRIAALKGNYQIFPGHGELTTLDAERAHNPYL